MKLTSLLMLSVAISILLFAPGLAAEEFVGLVKSVQGQASVARGGETKAVVAGMEIKMGDVLKTGGRIGRTDFFGRYHHLHGAPYGTRR